jgi:uncharacterized protein YndB with AHSA1/START domain
MTDRTVTHATFVIDRTFKASPARVFAAFADPTAKKRWFANPDESASIQHDIDFRVGGHETSRGIDPNGPSFLFDAVYQDIVPDQRIVTTYEMQMNDARISVSVATLELKPDGSATRLVYTEQGAFLDGLDTSEQREHGTRELFDALERELQRQPALS